VKYLFVALSLFAISFKSANSQSKILETGISLHCSNMTIEDIINKISKQENIRFSYGNLKDLKKKRSIYFTNGKLKFILSKLFKGTRIRYMSYSDQIILVETENLPQKKFILGYIVEDETNNAIPYATVMLLNSSDGVISDYKGRFEIEFESNTSDTLKFTSLGYESKKIATNKLLNKNSIKVGLEKKVFPLEDVNVSAKDYGEVFLGNNGISNLGALYLDTHGQEVALYIENHNKLNAKIEKIYFRLSSKGNKHAPFRIRVYDQDSTGTPGKDILKDLVVVKPDTDDPWFSIDISEYNIFLPETGLFVSMGGVFPNDYDFYFRSTDPDKPEKDKSNTKDLSYGQRLCYNKKGENNTWHYSLSHKWFQLDKKRFNVMIKLKLNYKKTEE